MAAATRRRPPFQVIYDDDDAVRVISVRGEIELTTAPRLAQHLQSAVRPPRPVLLDLCDASFMDSTGVHVLVGAHEELRATGATRAVACLPAGGPESVLRLSGVDSVVPVF